MSGQQIGTVVGAGVGFFFGAPQLGAAVGGLIGGWIKPTEVHGPHIGDGQNQSSAEGLPIAWVMGTAGWIQGQIVQVSERREVKKEDDGKGSGTVSVTYEAHQDYCILICESSEHRNSLMAGVLIVRLNGKIVYDMRAASNFGAENAKFLRNHTFYDGNEAQLPDPTMEAITGVGNTPYYRGVFTMVGRDVNLSQYGDAIPTYEFVMVGAGSAITEDVTELVSPELSRFQDESFPLVDNEADYDYTGYIGHKGSGGSGGGSESYSADTIAEIIAYFTAFDYSTFGGGSRAPSVYLGYSATTQLSAVPDIGLSIDAFGVSNAIAQPSVVDNQAVVLVYNDIVPTGTHSAIGFSGFCGIYPGAEQDMRGAVGEILPATPGGQYRLFESCGDPNLYGLYPLCIRVTRKQRIPVPQLGDPCLLGEPTLLPDSPGFVQDCAGNVTPLATYASVSGYFVQLQEAATTFTSGKTIFTKYPLGPVLLASDPNNTQAFWEAAYADAVAAGTMAGGLVWPTHYPVVSSTAYEATYTTTTLTEGVLGLDTAITRVCERGGLVAGDIDVTDMDQTVQGYAIAQTYDATECLRPLMTAYTSYGTEADSKIQFKKHGEAVELVVDPDDFVEGSAATDTDTREQAVEYPRLVSVTATDPTQDYTARPQTARRITPDIRAIGEESMQVPVVLNPDDTRQLSEIALKVFWARAQGTREFSLPYAGNETYLSLVPGDAFALDAKRYVVENLRVEDGEIHIEAVYDRQSAYTSNVTATPALPPTPPPSNLGGVTLFAAMNLPPLRDQDDKVGIYVAAAGLLPGWSGCLLQMSIDDGASWTTAIESMTQASTIGYLTAALPLASASGDDVTNTLPVAVHGGQLDSITTTQYLNEGNPCAIVKADGTAEVLQFLTAVETDPDEYDLTTLARGRLGTTPALHAQGTRFVALNGMYFLELPIGYIGRTLLLRPVTLGTVPENNASYSIVFNPCVVQTELAPEFITGRITGGSVVVSVTPRHRLGTDETPVASVNFIGYRFIGTDGTVTETYDVTNPSQAFDLSTFGSPLTITCAQLNRITGPGPTASIVI